jgi:transposase-like protein
MAPTEDILLQNILELKQQVAELASREAMSDRPWSLEETAFYFGVCEKTVRTWRAEWQEGIHYWRLPGNRGEYRYNPDLLKDWLENRTDPVAHQKAIAVWNSKRLCNQSTRKKAS